MSSFLRRLATGVREFIYNVSGARYETTGGGVVPEARVIAALEGRRDDGSQVVDVLWRQYVGGDISVRELQDALAVEIRRMHAQDFALGRGGWDRITRSDWRVIEQRVKDEIAFLRDFASEIRQGNVPEAEIKRRMQMYINDARTSYWDGKTAAMEAAGRIEEKRVLNPAEHCPDCTDLAGHWEPIGTLPHPGDGSQCMSNCACSMEYR